MLYPSTMKLRQWNYGFYDSMSDHVVYHSKPKYFWKQKEEAVLIM